MTVMELPRHAVRLASRIGSGLAGVCDAVGRYEHAPLRTAQDRSGRGSGDQQVTHGG